VQVEVYDSKNTKIAVVTSSETIINTIEDGIDIIGNLYFQDFDRVLMHEKNFSPMFFDLKSGMAGEILQKLSTYRVRLAIVDFSKYTSKSLAQFIFESNKGRQVNFVDSTTEALERLSI
jgi:Domain of unknown function (DUF4180)